MKYHIDYKTHLIILFGTFSIATLLAITPDLFLSIHCSCMIREILGINCPFCGMTRDFVLMSKGLEPVHNPFSIATAFVVFILYPLALVLSILTIKRFPISYTFMRNIFFIIVVVMFVFNNLN